MARLLWIPLLAGAIYAWDHSPVGLGWAVLLLGAAMVTSGVSSRGRVGRRAWLVAASPFLALAFLEFGLHWMTPPVIEDQEPDIFLKDDDVGYRLKPSTGGLHTKSAGDETIFSEHVSIADDGWRVVPRKAGAPATRTIDLLGCSFAFGYGLADDQTLAAVLQAALGPTDHVRSLSVRGWGPHQLLADLQSGRIAPVPGIAPGWVIYWAIPDHVQRAAGKRHWARRGPRFELDGGELTRQGNFDGVARLPRAQALAARLRGRSALARRVLEKANASTNVREEDLDRWMAIVEELRVEVTSWDPEPRFLVLLRRNGASAEALATRLSKAGIEILDPLRGADGSAEATWCEAIHARDKHPSAASVAHFVDAVVARIEANE